MSDHEPVTRESQERIEPETKEVLRAAPSMGSSSRTLPTPQADPATAPAPDTPTAPVSEGLPEATKPLTEALPAPPSDAAAAAPGSSAPARLFKVLLARETLPHFGVLALFMVLFLALTLRTDTGSGDWLLALGLGGPLAYLIAALLALTPLVKLVRHPRYGWALPLLLGLVLAYLLRRYLLDSADNAARHRELLELAFAGLFVLWQFLQAWWMRVPFDNWATRRFAGVGETDVRAQENEAEAEWGAGPVALVDRWATRLAGKGPILNALAPLVWALVGLGLFQLLYQAGIFAPEAGARFENYDLHFQAAWLATVVLVGLLLTLVVRRMLRWAPGSGRVALLSGAFAFGFWVFLAFHAFALFWSLGQAPSFAFDLLFMLVTILVALYSLSSRALRGGGVLVRPENVLFFGLLFGISYSASNFFLISDFEGFGNGFEPRTVGQLSHLVAGACGAFILLLVNVDYLHREGHLPHRGLAGLRKALSKPYPPISTPTPLIADTDPAEDKET